MWERQKCRIVAIAVLLLASWIVKGTPGTDEAPERIDDVLARQFAEEDSEPPQWKNRALEFVSRVRWKWGGCIEAIATAPPYTRFATLSTGGQLSLWNLPNASLDRTLDERVEDSYGVRTPLCMESSETWLAGLHVYKGPISIWQLETGEARHIGGERWRRSRRAGSLALDRERKRLYVGRERQIVAYDCTDWTGEPLDCPTELRGSRPTLRFAAGALYAARGGRMWKWDGRWEVIIPDIGAAFYSCAIAPDASRAYFGLKQGDVRVWTLPAQGPPRDIQLPHRRAARPKYLRDDHVQSIAVSADGRWVYVANGVGVYLLDVARDFEVTDEFIPAPIPDEPAAIPSIWTVEAYPGHLLVGTWDAYVFRHKAPPAD